MINYKFDWLDSDATIHITSENHSFLVMEGTLRAQGIMNSKFFLALHDEDLLTVDPHSEDLSPETMAKVVQECVDNPWYFFREVVRVPYLQNSPASGFRLNMTNLAQLWLAFQGVTHIAVVPRFCGDLATLTCMLAYWTYVQSPAMGEPDNLCLFSPSEQDAIHAIAGIKMVRDMLPSYFWNKSAHTHNSHRSMIQYRPDGKTTTTVHTVSANRSVKIAQNHGRGHTFSTLVVDQAAKCVNIEESLRNLTLAINGDTARGVFMNTRPGLLDTAHGVFVRDLLQKAYRFDNRLYDLDADSDLTELVNLLSETNMLHVEFSAEQLGKDEDWFKLQKATLTDELFRKEILLEWI